MSAAGGPGARSSSEQSWDAFLEDLDDQTGEPVEVIKAQIGLEIARWLLLLIVLVLVLVGLFAWLTYPGGGTAETVVDVRREWFSNVKDLLQLLVVSMLVPLLASVIGFIFGRQTAGEPAS